MREALELAETMSPCVLWIDEIEKGIAVGDNDGGYLPACARHPCSPGMAEK
ncbi:hypothetical protein [Alcanivorax sp.]|uniref:hypothetical protein n=1 Tax=Alcanivorax sp. TaxID=1872427 RepID=UPI003BAD6149